MTAPRMSRKDVDAVRALIDEGVTQIEIARRYGVTPGRVSAFVQLYQIPTQQNRRRGRMPKKDRRDPQGRGLDKEQRADFALLLRHGYSEHEAYESVTRKRVAVRSVPQNGVA